MSHVVVCGLGQVGYRTARLLNRMGQDVTVVSKDSREDWQEDLVARGVKFVDGDARAEGNLQAAGVGEAVAVVACISRDLVNLEVALDVARTAPNARVVVRLFDPELAARLQSKAGIGRALTMSDVAAPAFVAAALGSGVETVFGQGEETFEVVREAEGRRVRKRERPVHPPSSRLRRLFRNVFQTLWFPVTLWKHTSPQLRYLAYAVVAMVGASVLFFQNAMRLSALDSLYFVLTTVTTTGYGDITPHGQGPWVVAYVCLLMLLGSASMATMYSILTDYIVRMRLDQLTGRQSTRRKGHVIVVGLGNVGFIVVKELLRSGVEVTVVDRHPENDLRSLLPKRVPVMVGDGRDTEVLSRAGLAHAAAVVAVTNDDVTNLSVGMAAKSKCPSVRAVAQHFDDSFAKKAAGVLPIDATLSASRIAAPVFVGAALFPECVHAYQSGEELVVIHTKGEGFEVSSFPLSP